MRRAVATAGFLLLAARPAATGELAVEAQVGYFDMAAKSSAQALFGSSGGATFGGAVRYNVWRGAFVSAGLRTSTTEGSPKAEAEFTFYVLFSLKAEPGPSSDPRRS